jgi:GrpB-like predicted nucleotidyltransferase (UPF0157 family)
MKKALNELTTEELGTLFPIIITPYNPEWIEFFRVEKQNIIESLGKNLIEKIEHIGSTAIPGLCAKPTIDILIEIPDNIDPVQYIGKLEDIKYHYIPKPENPPPGMMFAKGYSNTGISGQTFHVHLRNHGEQDEIIFRDFLTANHDAVLEYADLKRSLSQKFTNDREKYTEGKTDFIKGVVELARSA